MKAIEPSELRELDAWILEHVFGWKRGRRYGNGNGEWILPNGKIKTWDTSPQPTREPAAALAVLEKCAEHGNWPEFKRLNKTEPVGHYVWYHPRDNSEYIAETLYLAICRFAKQLLLK